MYIGCELHHKAHVVALCQQNIQYELFIILSVYLCEKMTSFQCVHIQETVTGFNGLKTHVAYN